MGITKNIAIEEFKENERPYWGQTNPILGNHDPPKDYVGSRFYQNLSPGSRKVSHQFRNLRTIPGGCIPNLVSPEKGDFRFLIIARASLPWRYFLTNNIFL